MSFKTSVLFAAAATAVSARTFTVINNCPFTIWPAIFTGAGTAVPNQPTGWEAGAHTQVSFNVPDNWTAGRIWGRRNCDFSQPNPGVNSCLDGGCNGGLECAAQGGTGVPPATLAEWTLSADPNGQDNYDVSLVDGYNLPMRIDNDQGCHVADCPVDLGPMCPAALKGPFDSTGSPVGCKSDCDVSSTPANSPACCSGQFNTPATCPNSGVPNYHFFKGNCPNAYAYAYDESSGTALWTCSSKNQPNYKVTFCP